ncbi:MAG: heterodisulfide reductase-related iron-sulfur binding cluster [Pseudomonadota bacterium]
MKEAITFWYGCNVLRHGDIIHGCLDILRALDFDVRPAGGPDYCCGTRKDANQTAAGGMATRTVDRFNAMARERVVAWCPSCHAHMHDFMARANDTQFVTTHTIELLYANRAKLARLLIHPVPLRVLVHKHVGFNDMVEVNQIVPELLRMIPGIEVVENDYLAPGYMCASLIAVPGAIDDMFARTVRAVRATGAEAVVSMFHQCYREFCGLEAQGITQVSNYIQLLARSMGIAYADEYKAWKKAGVGAAELIGEERIAKVGAQFFEQTLLPELKNRPKIAI